MPLRGKKTPSATRLCLGALLALAVWFVATIAHADGGLLAFTAVRDGRRIAVFTTPTPPRVGPLDVSILIQDPSGQPLLDLPITVIATSLNNPKKSLRVPATQDAATNKLLRAAQFDLGQPGSWQIEVFPKGFTGDPLRFTFEVQDGPPAWFDMTPWFAWPLAAIGLFAVHQWLVGRWDAKKIRGKVSTVTTE